MAEQEHKSNPSLQGKLALVTGASRGIGAAIAKRLAAEGAQIVLTYASSGEDANDVCRDINDAGGQAEAMQADAADIEAGKALVDKLVGAHGKIDILVNNAGTLQVAEIADATPEQFDLSIDVNLRGPYFLIQSVAPHMPAGGRVVNISSIFADVTPFPGLGLYAMSKFGVHGMTRALARELAGQAITVNAVAPGPIDTKMNPEDGPLAEALTPRSPLGRYGRPEDIAETVAYLVGPHSDNVNGAVLTVDGGWTA
jgi:3-oxoacyl-[acyl-carrier protein] reductase